MPDKNTAKAFIAGLKFPKFGAYVVSHLVKHFGITRDEAVQLWDELREEQ